MMSEANPESSVVRKFRWRVLVPIVVLIVFSSLDRVNISFAKLHMNVDIGLTDAMYTLAVVAFFAGYLLFQFPSTALLKRIGARRWIAACVLLWGAAATATAFVRNPIELYILRFVLGIAEAGFAPGIVYYCSGWMPQRYRANAIAITMLAIPISGVFGSPLCGWLMQVANPLDVAGWRWMLLVEGVATLVCGAIAYFWFVDGPAQARWVTNAEREWLEAQLSAEQCMAPVPKGAPLAVALGDVRCWLAAGVWFSSLVGSYGLMFWLPQVVKDFSSTLSDFAIGVVTAVPWLGLGLGMWFNSRHSDATGERYWHVGLPLAVGAIALFGAASVSPGFVALILLFLSGLGLGSAQGVFWSIPTTFLHRSTQHAGITLINLVGNIGSVVGPSAIGWIRTQTDVIAAPVWLVAGVMSFGALLLVSLHARRT